MDVVEVSNQEQLKGAYKVRHEVFVKEQEVPKELEIDEHENEAFHFVAYDGETPIGAGRFRIVGEFAKVERISVLPSYRGTGTGLKIMEAIEHKAEIEGQKIMKLHAQKSASGFYEKLGYQVTSGEFMDAGIPHVEMKKKVSDD